MRKRLRTAGMLSIALIMVLSAMPFTALAENQYQVIVLNENKLFKVGDEVTLEIHFYDKDSHVDADEVNITIGYPEWGMGRWIEVDEASAKTATGVYSVTFTIEEEDVSYGVSGTVICRISEGRAEEEAEAGFLLYVEGMAQGTFFGELSVDKPRLGPGETVRFDVTFFNGTPAEKVDPDSIGADLIVNGVEESITMSQDSRAVGEYYYEYTDPNDGVGRIIGIDIYAKYGDEGSNWISGESILTYYQI